MALSCLLGCATSRVPFTQQLREQHKLTADELKNLQYYASHTITLRREVDSTSRQITGGHRLVLTSGKSVEQFVVKAGTPGIAKEVGATSLVVSFGDGADFRFGLRGDGDYAVDPSDNQAYAQAPEAFPGNSPRRAPAPLLPVQTGLTGNYWLSIPSPQNEILFQGSWFAAVEESLQAHLLVEAEALNDVEEKKTVLPGVKLR